MGSWSRRHRPLAEKFSDYVDRSGDCWVWMGSRLPKGYGVTSDRGKHLLAHRVAWELAHGPIRAGLLVLHRCDNPPCVRPDHLFIGTQKDNVADMVTKGRHVSRVLTEAERERFREWVRAHPNHWAQQANCPNGHPYTPENTYWYRGVRLCRECGRARNRRAYARKRAAA